MTPPSDAATQRDLGRFETRLESLEDSMEGVRSDLRAIRTKLDEAAGGMTVLRWLGFGSLAGGILALSQLYQWLHRP
jgi:hypothetical protein